MLLQVCNPIFAVPILNIKPTNIIQGKIISVIVGVVKVLAARVGLAVMANVCVRACGQVYALVYLFVCVRMCVGARMCNGVADQTCKLKATLTGTGQSYNPSAVSAMVYLEPHRRNSALKLVIPIVCVEH